MHTGKRRGAPSIWPDRWNREQMRGFALPSDSFPQIFRFVRQGAAMDTESNKYRRFEEEFLIPVGFGWMVMVIALYIAVVLIQ